VTFNVKSASYTVSSSRDDAGRTATSIAVFHHTEIVNIDGKALEPGPLHLDRRRGATRQLLAGGTGA
jgi:hypothetical protein